MEKDVVPVHRSIMTHMDQLTDIQSNLYLKYREYLEKNKILQVFGLDSFHYQCRLFDLELKHAHEQYSFLNNRMYCDYYKLYHVVKLFVSDTFQHEAKKRTFPVYKDLEPYKLYEMSDITLLYEDIGEMIRKASMEMVKKEKDLTRDAQEKGLRLEHFIHHRASNHALLTTKIELYEKYLHAYHIYHMSFLSNFLERLKMLFRQNEPTIDAKTYPPEPMTKYLPADPAETEVLVEEDRPFKEMNAEAKEDSKDSPPELKEDQESCVEINESKEAVSEVKDPDDPEVQEEKSESPELDAKEKEESEVEPVEPAVESVDHVESVDPVEPKHPVSNPIAKKKKKRK